MTRSVAREPPAVGDGVADGKTALTALPETMTTSVSPLPRAVSTDEAAKVSGAVLNVHTKDCLLENKNVALVAGATNAVSSFWQFAGTGLSVMDVGKPCAPDRLRVT